MNQSGTSSAIAICVAGLAIAFALWSGLTSIAKVVQQQSFHSSGPHADTSDTVLLSGNKFAVIGNGVISVYWVDADGKISRTDDVQTSFEPIKKFQRYDPNGNLQR